jgi:hypothetical protein
MKQAIGHGGGQSDRAIGNDGAGRSARRRDGDTIRAVGTTASGSQSMKPTIYATPDGPRVSRVASLSSRDEPGVVSAAHTAILIKRVL